MRAWVHTTQKVDRLESPQAVCPEDVDRTVATRGSLHGKRTLTLLLASGIRLYSDLVFLRYNIISSLGAPENKRGTWVTFPEDMVLIWYI